MTQETEFTIRAANHANIHVSDNDEEVLLSVWILHGHTSVSLTKEQAKQLVCALQSLVEEEAA